MNKKNLYAQKAIFNTQISLTKLFFICLLISSCQIVSAQRSNKTTTANPEDHPPVEILKHFISSIGDGTDRFMLEETEELNLNIEFVLRLPVDSEIYDCNFLDINSLYIGYRLYTEDEVNLYIANYVFPPNLNGNIPFNEEHTKILKETPLHHFTKGIDGNITEQYYESTLELDIPFDFLCEEIVGYNGSLSYGSNNYIEFKFYRKVGNDFILHDFSNLEPTIIYNNCHTSNNFSIYDQEDIWEDRHEHLRSWILAQYRCTFDNDELRMGSPENKSSKNIQVFPNPVSDISQVQFELANDANAIISLMDINGKTIKEINRSFYKGNNIVSFDTVDLSKGIYFCTIKTTESTSYNTVKFIKL